MIKNLSEKSYFIIFLCFRPIPTLKTTQTVSISRIVSETTIFQLLGHFLPKPEILAKIINFQPPPIKKQKFRKMEGFIEILFPRNFFYCFYHSESTLTSQIKYQEL